MNLSKKDGGLVTFGNNKKGKIIGKGTIDNDSGTLIENVLLVDGSKQDYLALVNYVINVLELYLIKIIA